MVSRPALRLVLLAALSLAVSGAWAQTRSTSFDYTAYNAYWNGANWLSFGSGYGNVLGTDTTTGNFSFYTTGNAASAGLARTLVPVVTMSGSGVVSATSFVGYTGSFGNVNATGTVSTAALVVNGVAITGNGGSSDRIASSTTVTNTTQVTANSTGYISLTTGGTTTGYFNTAGGLVVPSVSTTGTISGTRGYFTESLGVGRAIESWMPSNTLVAKGLVIADSGLSTSAGAGLGWEDGHVSIASNDGTDVELRTNYVARLKILSNGYVGISTTSPNATLDVNGTVSATAVQAGAGSFSGKVGVGTTNPTALIDATNASDIANITITGYGDTINYSGMSLGQYGTTKQWWITHAINTLNAFKVSYYNGSAWITPLTILPSGNVGIETTNPTSNLKIVGNGWASAQIESTVTNNISALFLSNSADNKGMYVGYDSNSNNPKMIFNYDSVIGTFNKTMLTLYNTGNATLYGTLTQNSDARLKSNIQPLQGPLDKLELVKGVSFYWKSKGADPRQQIGVIAQDVEKAYPQLVSTDSSGTKSVNYNGLVAPLIEAVKELKRQQDADWKAIQDLKAENANIRREFDDYRKTHK